MSDSRLANPSENTAQEKPPRVELDSPEGIAQLKEFVKILYTINHDLNNPLAGVIGYTELAVSDPDSLPKNVLDYLGKVQTSATKMEELIQRCAKAKHQLHENVDITELKPADQ